MNENIIGWCPYNKDPRNVFLVDNDQSFIRGNRVRLGISLVFARERKRNFLLSSMEVYVNFVNYRSSCLIMFKPKGL
jgi:hypothetical protein